MTNYNQELNDLTLHYFNQYGIEDYTLTANYSDEYLVSEAEKLFGFDLNNDGFQAGITQTSGYSPNAIEINPYDFALRNNLTIFDNENDNSEHGDHSPVLEPKLMRVKP